MSVSEIQGILEQRTFVQPIYKTSKYGLDSFKCQGAKLRNELATKSKVLFSLDDFHHFTERIQSWTGALCTCSRYLRRHFTSTFLL